MRQGYNKEFLGASYIIKLPNPGLSLQSDILQPPLLPEGEVVVPYINYSLLRVKVLSKHYTLLQM